MYDKAIDNHIKLNEDSCIIWGSYIISENWKYYTLLFILFGGSILYFNIQGMPLNLILGWFYSLEYINNNIICLIFQYIILWIYYVFRKFD